MAKLTNLMNKLTEARRELLNCTQAYTELLEKYRKLFIKHSYEETMGGISKIEDKKKEEKNNIKVIE